MASVRAMGRHKRIGFAAHNEKKEELIQCLRKHAEMLREHKLYGTGTTGRMIRNELRLDIECFNSGPLGGDQQMGALIATDQLDILVFLVDPLSTHAHAFDVEALLRLARVYGIICATTVNTIDGIFCAESMQRDGIRKIPTSGYLNQH